MRSVTRALLERKVTAIAYETIQLDDGSLPLLAPMSEIAGRLSIQVGAWCFRRKTAGAEFSSAALRASARPMSSSRRRHVRHRGMPSRRRHGRLCEHSRYQSDQAALRPRHTRRPCHDADVESRQRRRRSRRTPIWSIGSVLIPGAQAPKLIPRALVKTNETRRGVRRHLHRSRRLRRNFAPDQSPRSDLRRGRSRPLLRDQHARDRAQHIDLRPHQFDAFVRPRVGQPRHSRGARRATKRSPSGVNTYAAK